MIRKDRLVSERVIAKIGPRKASKLIISPNGRRIVFIVGVGKSRRDERGEKVWDEYAIVVDGRERSPQYIIWSPFFSPDSRRLAYVIKEDNIEYIVQLSSDKKYSTEEVVGAKRFLNFRFSPDSQKIAYTTDSRRVTGPSYVVIGGRKSQPYAKVSKPIFSPSSRRIAYIVTDYPSGYYVVLNEKKGKRYDGIPIDNNLVFSPDSNHYAYRAVNRKGAQKVFVVLDGREGKSYVGMANYLKFSPDSKRILYVAQLGAGKWTVVVDSKDNSCRLLFFISCGKEGKHYSARYIRNPKFSPDSKHVVYVVNDSHVRFVVLDGKEGKAYSGKRLWLDYALFSPDSKRIAYPVRIENDWWFVVDNKKEGKRYKWVGRIVFSPDSSQLAYVAREDDGYFVVVNGKESNRYDRVSDLVFSPDSKTLAYAAYNRSDKKWHVVVNEKEGRRYDLVVTSQAHRLIGFGVTGSLRFVSSDRLHYLAVQDNQTILLVEEKLK